MSNAIIEKVYDIQGKDEIWQLIDKEHGRQVTVIFSKELEDDLHRRNHSFDRLQSEQLNAVLKAMNQLDKCNYVLEINEESIGTSITPLPQEKILDLIKLV